ncbi:MAG: SMC-Scp complex subunit ScpB [Candidatus Binatia bacterium]
MDETEASEPTVVSEAESEAAEVATGDTEIVEEAAPGDAEGDQVPPAADETASGRIERIIESVLFAAAAPVSLRRLVEILAGPPSKEVQAAVARLMQEYAPGQRGIQLREVAGGYQFRTARENAEWVRAIFREKPARMGRAALETLAIVAYKQPVTRAEIEAIRGVDVDGVLSTLLSRRLIKIGGRKEAVGRPLLYGTTPEFLEVFGLKDMNELPSLKELGPAPDTDDEGTSTEVAPQEWTATEAEAGAACQSAEDGGAPAEDPESGGDRIEAEGGGADPGGSCASEQPGGDPTGNESEPPDGSHHD